jgi:hypothetical protein
MPPVTMALRAERCVAYDLEVFVIHPERCEDRLPVELEGKVWIRLRRGSPQQWILLLKLTSNQDTMAHFVMPHPTRVHKLHERVYKACILAACRRTHLHAWRRPGLLVAKVMRAGIGLSRRRYVWV